MTILIQSNNMALCIQPVCKSEDKASWYELSFGNNPDDDAPIDGDSSFAAHSALPLDLQLDIEDESFAPTTILDDFDDSCSCNSSFDNSFNSTCSTVRSNVSKKSTKRGAGRSGLSRGPSFRLGSKQNSIRLLYADDEKDNAAPPPPMQVSVSVSNTPPPPSRLGMFKKHLGDKYTGFKERTKRANESNERRDLVKSALYTCIEDDDEENLLETMLSASRQPRPLPNVAVSPSARNITNF
jgi:hypothetical protein